MNIVFMGTPEFARVILEKLHTELGPVKAVVTQPDRPKGRGGNLEAPPVKKFALEKGIPILQPEYAFDIVDDVIRLRPDFIVVAAFGQILNSDILEIPRKASINVHSSLLPRHRGASPIQRAVIDGDAITGITTMLMDEGLDTGDILLMREVAILPDENAAELHDRLAAIGADLIVETLKTFDSITPQKQDNSKATYTGRLHKYDGIIDWTKSSGQIANLVRGCVPWPCAFTQHAGKTIKIYAARPLDENKSDRTPGTVIETRDDGIVVATGSGRLLVSELQLEGKKRMKAAELLRGYSIASGDIFSIPADDVNK